MPGATFYNRKFYIVTFSTEDGGIGDCIALMDEAPGQLMGGHGGWQVTQREHRLGVTQWRGNDPIRLAIPVLFDSSIHSIMNQGIAMHNLRLMGRPPTVSHGEPPRIYVKGPGVPDATSKGDKQLWGIENLQWGTQRNLSVNGDEFRQDVVVNLLEIIDEDRVDFPNLPTISKKRGKKKHKKDPKPAHRPKKSGWPKFYSVQPGDTLQKIAARFYHDSSEWKRIANANHIRDPKMLPPILIIPPPA